MGFFSSLSFLTPLYVAAGLAIGLPILFHLIRRTPQGKQNFSSVMFLSPAPPRITRRSRIEDWLLLLLRGLAVLLLVAAFCRPLWRELAAGRQGTGGQELVLLLDTSASMQRAGLWDQARAQVAHQIEGLDPYDRVTLLSFDDQVRVVMDRDEWLELDAPLRTDVLNERLSALQPGWGATELGAALREAADRLEQAETGPAAVGRRTVVLISDLQEGSRWESLQGIEWPEGISVQFAHIGEAARPTNATLHLVGRPELGENPFVRLRITNASNSERETFQVGWRDEFDHREESGPTTGIQEVYVPPGQSRVIRLPHETGTLTSARAVLAGDDHPFDNQCYIGWTERRQELIVYLGTDEPGDRNGLRFFLDPLFADTPQREVTILDHWPGSADESNSDVPANPEDLAASTRDQPSAPADRARPSLVIVAGELSEQQVGQVHQFLTSGGQGLFVCRDVESAAGLYPLSGLPLHPITEARVADYAMLREVDFTHPLFAALKDPRFSDVSKVHFWKHRRLERESLPDLRVLARFDSGDVAIGEVPVGTGRLIVLTTGWNRSDSELATWPKFVPIMNALLASGRIGEEDANQLSVGDRLPLHRWRDRDPAPVGIVGPGGLEIPWAQANSGYRVDRPGLYRLKLGDASATDEPEPVFSVNLPVDESQTAPLESDIFESLGIATAPDPQAEASTEARSEQVARSELESRQKLWRWLLAAALGVLIAETLLAARRRRIVAEAT